MSPAVMRLTNALSSLTKRISVMPGVELHVRADLGKPRPRKMNEWLARIEIALRKSL